MKILVSGSLAYDNIMNFPGKFEDHILPDKIHNINVSFFIEKRSQNFGGTAGNIAYSLSLLGEEPVILAAAGNDFNRYKKWLIEKRINVDYIKIAEDETTAMANIITDKADNQIAAFYPGAMQASGFDSNDANIKEAAVAIISPGNKDDMLKYAEFYSKNNIPFIFDPGQQIPVFTGEELRFCIKKAKIFICNDYELSLVIKATGWSEDDILANTEMLIVTLGEEGSKIRTRANTYFIEPAKPNNILDPTGAGDAYRAGLIKGLIEKWPLVAVGRFAGVVACYTVEKYGTQTHQFDFEDVMRRYRENFGEFHQQ